MREITSSEFFDHYKNLQHSLKRYRRVHIDGNLVLLFYLEGDIVYFEDLDHHDKIYKR